MNLIHFSHFACPLQLVNRAVRYSFTFSENLTLPLGLLTAHPVRRDEWGEVSTGEVSCLSNVEVFETSTPLTSPVDEEEDIQCVQKNSERQDLVDKVNKEIKVSHPICYDT